MTKNSQSKLVPKEYLGAFKRGHRRSSKEYIDEEFSYTLLKKAENGCEESKKALEWLTRFNNEFHKSVIKKDDPENLHHTDDLRRDCIRRDNARRWDVYTLLPLLSCETEYQPILKESYYLAEEDEFEQSWAKRPYGASGDVAAREMRDKQLKRVLANYKKRKKRTT